MIDRAEMHPVAIHKAYQAVIHVRKQGAVKINDLFGVVIWKCVTIDLTLENPLIEIQEISSI